MLCNWEAWDSHYQYLFPLAIKIYATVLLYLKFACFMDSACANIPIHMHTRSFSQFLTVLPSPHGVHGSIVQYIFVLHIRHLITFYWRKWSTVNRSVEAISVSYPHFLFHASLNYNLKFFLGPALLRCLIHCWCSINFYRQTNVTKKSNSWPG